MRWCCGSPPRSFSTATPRTCRAWRRPASWRRCGLQLGGCMPLLSAAWGLHAAWWCLDGRSAVAAVQRSATDHPLLPARQFHTAFNPDAEYQRIQRARQRLAQIRANVENTAAQLEAQEQAGAGWAGS